MQKGLDSYQRFLNGDESGLEEVIAEYKNGLILYLHGIVQDLQLAEEATEETFVKLVVKRPHFNGSSSFKTWLYTIGRNVAIDSMRRRKNYEIPLDNVTELRDEACLEQTYIQQERKRMVHKCMKALKPEYRQVLWLLYFEGFSCKQIARIMRKTTHSVETTAYRARVALKNILIKEGYNDEDQ